MSKHFYFKKFNKPFSSIWLIDRNLSGSTSPGESGPGSDGTEGVLCTPPNSTITGASLSNFLVSFPGHSSGEPFVFGVFCSSSRLCCGRNPLRTFQEIEIWPYYQMLSAQTRLLWDFEIQTNHLIPFRKEDIEIVNKKRWDWLRFT